MQFSELPLHKSILKAVAEERFHRPTQVQEKAIPLVLAKKNVIVSAQTGTGKTAAFALPIIQLLLDKKVASIKIGFCFPSIIVVLVVILYVFFYKRYVWIINF